MAADEGAPSPIASPVDPQRLFRPLAVGFCVMLLLNILDRDWLDAAQIGSLLPALVVISRGREKRSLAARIVIYLSIASMAVLTAFEHFRG